VFPFKEKTQLLRNLMAHNRGGRSCNNWLLFKSTWRLQYSLCDTADTQLFTEILHNPLSLPCPTSATHSTSRSQL